MTTTVVITGGTRGIGHGLASALLARGANVTVTGRTQETVDKAAAALGVDADDARVLGVAADVRDIEALQTVWDQTALRFGRVDAWVNNAGVSVPRKPIWELDPNDLELVVDVNLTGSLHGAHVALSGMTAQGSGVMYLMEGFGSGGQAQNGMAAYGATKRAVSYLKKALTKDLGKGATVMVGVLSPGIVVTELLTSDYEDAESWNKAKKIFDILGDRVETVTPFLADGIMKGDTSVKWLTTPKAASRFMLASKYRKRDIFADVPTPG